MPFSASCKPLLTLGILSALAPLSLAQPAISVSYPNMTQVWSRVGQWYYAGVAEFDKQKRPSLLGNNAPGPKVLLNAYQVAGDVSLRFNGCIGSTQLSYQWVALAVPSPGFTGDYYNSPMLIQVPLGLGTRWELPGRLNVIRASGNGETWEPLDPALAPAVSAQGFCGAYHFWRRGDKVGIHINGIKVYAADSQPSQQGWFAFAQSYDSPISLENLRFGADLD